MTQFGPGARLCACAIVALGLITGCSHEQSSSQAPSSSVTTNAAMPTAQPIPTGTRYMADTQAGGRPMAIGVSVDGDSVAAYACNGVDDEAWFFGNTSDGGMDLTSKFRDSLRAKVVGSGVEGTVTMNNVAYPFTAKPVSGAAGMYTAAVDNSRASWIVRPDGSVTAVQFNGGVSAADIQQAQDNHLDEDQFRAQVRNHRVFAPADLGVRIDDGKLYSKINNVDVVGVPVTGTFRLT